MQRKIRDFSEAGILSVMLIGIIWKSSSQELRTGTIQLD
jgi:hypothetical protein